MHPEPVAASHPSQLSVTMLYSVSPRHEPILEELEPTQFPAQRVLPNGDTIQVSYGFMQDSTQEFQLTLPQWLQDLAITLPPIDYTRARQSDESSQAHALLLDKLHTTYVAYAPLSQALSPLAQDEQILNTLTHVAELGLPPHTLLPHEPIRIVHSYHSRSYGAVSSYLQLLGKIAETDQSPLFTMFAATLALQHGRHSCESIDLSEDHHFLQVACRSFVPHADMQQRPSWEFEIVVADAQGAETGRFSATFAPRVNSQGVYRWENLHATVPLTALKDGNSKLLLALKDSSHQPRPLTPRVGLLANARTVIAQPHDTDIALRYLINTNTRVTDTWLTVLRETQANSGKLWRKMLRRKDYRLVRRRAAFAPTIMLRNMTRFWFRNRRIWVVGERSDTAQDNGYQLFRYLREQHPDIQTYYIIDKESPQLHKVAPYGNVVYHSSVKHRLLMLHAKVLANAYSINHLIPRQWNPRTYVRRVAWRVGALRVYLKHGINTQTNMLKRGTNGYDLYLTAMKGETQAVLETSGYNSEQVAELGLARYDLLVPTAPSKVILFMPTWRRYLVPKLFGATEQADIEFEGSTYQRFMQDFLTSERLVQMLEKYDYTLKFLPHYNLQEHLTKIPLSHARISFADPNKIDFQEIIRECDLFITDFSSVLFDIAYLGTPTLYTLFDAKEAAEGHITLSWFIPEKNGFGPVAYDLKSSLDELERYLATGATLAPEYQARVDASFTFRDTDNRKRTVNRIAELEEKLLSDL